LDDAAHNVQILMSQESEQDPNAAGAASNSNSDSDSEACAKLPRNEIGLKSTKKRKVIDSDQESDDVSTIVNAICASGDDKK